MTEQLRESLSALMDDEANELELERVLSKVGQDEELRQTWGRYQAVRSVTSGQPMAGMQWDISSRVSAAIAEESRASTSPVQRFLRPVASLAVAASVTAAVVVGGQQLAQLDDPYASGNQAVASSVSPVGLVNSLGATSVQASYGTQSVPVLQPATRTAYRELARQRMQKYMQEHAEQAALNSPQGLIPFARVPRIEE
jgi:sigma-E factor negative regulatory protein RseA